MTHAGPFRRALGTIGLAACAGLLLVACSTGPEFVSEVRPAGGRCVDDSPACVSARQAALRRMLADPKHRWVKDPADVHSYATGVRLFAFKTRKRDLNCQELAHGRNEAVAGPGVLRSPAGRHLTPAQVSRGVMFADEVSRELSREMRRRRCRA